MNKKKLFGRRGLRGKLILLCTTMVVVTAVSFAVISFLRMGYSWKLIKKAGRLQNDAIKKQSQDALTDLTNEAMLDTIDLTAKKADGEFWTLRHDFAIFASQVQAIFDHPEQYGEQEVFGPDPANKGKLVLQITFANPDAEGDPYTREMAGKLANLAPMMAEIIRGNDNYAKDCCIAQPDGTTLYMDTYSDSKVDEEGNVIPFDPRLRPWYVNAVEKGEFCFNPPTEDYFKSGDEVDYGYPIYADGKLVAVLEGSTALDTLKAFISDVGVGEHGFSIMISNDGQLIYSPRESGELKMTIDSSSDLENIDNENLRSLVQEAINHEKGLGEAEIDGEIYNAAYASMDTVGWTLITFVPRAELAEPTEALLADVDEVNKKAIQSNKNGYRQSFVMLLAVLIILIINALAAAVSLSNRITRPLNVMRDQLEHVTGDRFAFKMEDIYRTGDEIEVLAGTFAKLSDQMESHILEIMIMTAEKERVNTELALAARIQSDMLPATYPAFPDRHDFTIYASMKPAREVGGDFYDYFLVDYDHLAMVMADVAGKGIPAAMFMMMTRSMIQTQASAGCGPKEILETVNQLLNENNKARMFVTVWVGILNLKTGTLTAANAGHEYPVIKSPDGPFAIYKDEHGLVLGLVKDMKYREYELSLQPGAKLFVYTDGVPEAMDSSRNQFGMERTVQAVNTAANEEPEMILDAVDKAVADFVGDAEQFDDLTMLCIEYAGNAKKGTDPL